MLRSASPPTAALKRHHVMVDEVRLISFLGSVEGCSRHGCLCCLACYFVVDEMLSTPSVPQKNRYLKLIVVSQKNGYLKY